MLLPWLDLRTRLRQGSGPPPVSQLYTYIG